MQIELREYIVNNLNTAMRELEIQVNNFGVILEKGGSRKELKTKLLHRVKAYQEIIEKQKKLAERLGTAEIWNDKQELARVVKLIFNLSYFVQQDAQELVLEINAGNTTTNSEISVVH